MISQHRDREAMKVRLSLDSNGGEAGPAVSKEASEWYSEMRRRRGSASPKASPQMAATLRRAAKRHRQREFQRWDKTAAQRAAQRWKAEISRTSLLQPVSEAERPVGEEDIPIAPSLDGSVCLLCACL